MKSLVFCIGLCVLSFVRVTVQWADCGSGSEALIHISNFDINSVKGNLSVSLNGMLETGLTGPPKINVTVEKNLNGPWTQVPCINKIGSCLYDGPCEFIKTLFNVASCPVVYRGKGCSGLSLYDPIPYFLDTTYFNLATAAVGTKNSLTGSALRVQADMLQQENNKFRRVGCVSFFISLEMPCEGFLCP